MGAKYTTARGSIVVLLTDVAQEYLDFALRKEVMERCGNTIPNSDDQKDRLERGVTVELAVTIAIPTIHRVSSPDGAPFDLVRDQGDGTEVESFEAKGFRHEQPDLWVPASQPLNAEKYICGHYEGEGGAFVELVGWASQATVADAPVVERDHMTCQNRVVKMSDLRPMTDLTGQHSR